MRGKNDERKKEMKRTGKFVSKEECDRLLAIFHRTKEPLFGCTASMMQHTCERVDAATAELYSEIDKTAVLLGCPEPVTDADGDIVHYGLDFNTSEIMQVEDKGDE